MSATSNNVGEAVLILGCVYLGQSWGWPLWIYGLILMGLFSWGSTFHHDKMEELSVENMELQNRKLGRECMLLKKQLSDGAEDRK